MAVYASHARGICYRPPHIITAPLPPPHPCRHRTPAATAAAAPLPPPHPLAVDGRPAQAQGRTAIQFGVVYDYANHRIGVEDTCDAIPDRINALITKLIHKGR